MPRQPRTLEQGKANMEASLTLIPDRYRQGVQVADWKTAAGSDAAEQLFASKMGAAITNKSRQKGIARVTNEQWKERALASSNAMVDGMRRNLDKWATNFAKPYNAAMAVVKALPPRGADPMGNIDKRLKPVVDAFVKNRTRG